MNVYDEIKKPIVGLAPMEDVTDSVFRRIVLSLGMPDVMYTEFVNVEGLNSDGADSVMHRLRYSESEHPLIAQLWGNTPKNFLKSANLAYNRGFDGIDINMGCSVKNVVKGCAGSALIDADRELVINIIDSVKTGGNGLPISVKTRLGFNEVNLDWIKFLLHQNLNALTIHMRTARGKDSITANWEHLSQIVNLRNEISPTTLILGNGDIKSVDEAYEKISTYNIDGVLIGRAAISNPWIFSKRNYEDIPLTERIDVFKRHLALFEETWGNTKDFNSLKKFFRSYISGFEGASELRQKLMLCSNIDEVLDTINKEVKI